MSRIGELTAEEQKFLDTEGYKFLKAMGNTLMTKSYKMPLLLAFYNNGNFKTKLNQDDVYKSFKDFYSSGTNAADLLMDKGGRDYKSWGMKEYLKVAQNPIDAFMNTAGEYFSMEGEYFCLSDSIGCLKEDRWFIQNFKDIIDYRIRKYYKTRIKEKAEGNMLKIKFALRDERINIFAMTHGGIPQGYPNQIILCKKSPVPERRKLFLLDAKKSSANYELSQTGKAYMEMITAEDFELRYAAFVDCQLKIRVSKKLFEKIYSDGFFTIWDPAAPVKYFDSEEEGYLVLFRVYRIDTAVDENLLEKGRKGRNYFFKMDDIVYAKPICPVIDDMTFEEMKTRLINMLEQNNWLIEKF